MAGKIILGQTCHLSYGLLKRLWPVLAFMVWNNDALTESFPIVGKHPSHHHPATLTRLEKSVCFDFQSSTFLKYYTRMQQSLKQQQPSVRRVQSVLCVTLQGAGYFCAVVKSSLEHCTLQEERIFLPGCIFFLVMR